MSMKTLALCASLTAAIALTGCSSAGGTGAARPVSAVRDRNVISEAELLDPNIRDLDVIEVVRRLRPNFLADHGIQSKEDAESGRVHASIDGIAVIALDELRGVFARSIVEIRYLSASAAMQRFGSLAHAGPVILVRTS